MMFAVAEAGETLFDTLTVGQPTGLV